MDSCFNRYRGRQSHLRMAAALVLIGLMPGAGWSLDDGMKPTTNRMASITVTTGSYADTVAMDFAYQKDPGNVYSGDSAMGYANGVIGLAWRHAANDSMGAGKVDVSSPMNPNVTWRGQGWVEGGTYRNCVNLSTTVADDGNVFTIRQWQGVARFDYQAKKYCWRNNSRRGNAVISDGQGQIRHFAHQDALKYDADSGTLYWVYPYSTGTEERAKKFYIRYSTDAGDTWKTSGDNFVATDGSGNDGTEDEKRCATATALLGTDGRMHVFYTQRDGTDLAIGHVYCDDPFTNANTWVSGASPLPWPVYKSWCALDAAVGSDGVLHLCTQRFYATHDGSSPNTRVELRYAYSTDSGATWSNRRVGLGWVYYNATLNRPGYLHNSIQDIEVAGTTPVILFTSATQAGDVIGRATFESRQVAQSAGYRLWMVWLHEPTDDTTYEYMDLGAINDTLLGGETVARGTDGYEYGLEIFHTSRGYHAAYFTAYSPGATSADYSPGGNMYLHILSPPPKGTALSIR